MDTDLLGQEEQRDGDESCDELNCETDEEGSLIHFQGEARLKRQLHFW